MPFPAWERVRVRAVRWWPARILEGADGATLRGHRRARPHPDPLPRGEDAWAREQLLGLRLGWSARASEPPFLWRPFDGLRTGVSKDVLLAIGQLPGKAASGLRPSGIAPAPLPSA